MIKAQEALSHISQLSNAQIEALRTGDQTRVIELDKELELALGDKERAMGALTEHRKEHGC